MTAMGKRGKMILGGLALGLVLMLAACYLPNHFKSEIRLGRTGSSSVAMQKIVSR